MFCGYQIDNKWITERRQNKNKRSVHSSPINFESNNYVNLLDDEKANSITPNYPDNEIIHKDNDTAISKHDIKQRVTKKVKSNEKGVYASKFPERNTLSKKRTEQNRSREEKSKVVILSDSITKRINMLKFNNELKHDGAVKRVFPGATTSHLIHYVNACLVEDKPTKIIICGGTNNLSKKNQNAREIVKEIVEIVDKL